MEQVDISRTMKCAHQKWGIEAKRLPNINQIRQRKKTEKQQQTNRTKCK